MERNAHYALVGFAASVLVVALLLFVVWLARVQFAAQYALYDIDFKGPVRGLSAGGEVYFNGIKVGEVTRLSLDRQDANRVVARIRVSADAPIKTDSVATLEPQGVTGVSYVQIAAGDVKSPLLRETAPAGAIPVIRSRPGTLDALLQGGGTVVDRSVQALDRVNRLLSDQNLADASAILANLKDASALAKDQGRLLDDLDVAVKSLQQTSAHVDALALQSTALVNGPGKTTLANLDSAATQVRSTAAAAEATMNRLKGPVTDFADNGLPQLSRTIITLQAASEALDRLVGEVEQNPRALLAKPPAKTVHVQP